MGALAVVVVKKVALSFLSEKIVIKIAVALLEKLVKSTKNTLDNEIVNEVKKNLGV